MNELDKLVSEFRATPFLFVGSGLTKRYYDLPDWPGLLKIFASRLSTDVAIYSKYVNIAKVSGHDNLPSVATAIEKDFNERWFNEPNFRMLPQEDIQNVSELNISPFKAEIAYYIVQNSEKLINYYEEIEKFKQLSDKHITGIITTNYDCFLEEITGFKTYVGQNELIFSNVQGIAEIYKIHGSVTQPESIVINSNDYDAFTQKSKYLAAKLMTVFMEYPIIFMGYSMSDTNVQNILKSIVECMPESKRKLLEKNFIFIDFNRDMSPTNVIISPFVVSLDGTLLTMTKVTLSNYSLLYSALCKKKSGLPVKLLRMFKKEFYSYTLTNTPTSNMRVAAVDDNRVDDEELVLAICKPSDIGRHGLTGLKPDDIYADVILDNLKYTPDEVLTDAYPELIRKANKLPVHKLLSKAQNTYPNIIPVDKYDSLLNASILKARKTRLPLKHRNIDYIINNYQIAKAISYIPYLVPEEIDLSVLHDFLYDLLTKDETSLAGSAKDTMKSDIRRLIRIYDWLKYKEKPLG